jgi:arabinose-5-phosphate isomerase
MSESKVNNFIEEAKNVFEHSIQALRLAETKLDDNFTQAVYHIADARKVIVTGVGKSGIIGRKIAATFSSIGIPSVFIHPVDALHGDIGIVSTGDVVMMLSKSGSTEELCRLVPYLKSRNIYSISIVGNIDSELARESDVVINGYVTREACPLNIAPTTSALVALAIGDALTVCVMKLKQVSIEDFSRQHPLGQIGRTITLKVKDVYHKGNDLPQINHNATFKEAIIEISQKGLGCVCITDDRDNLLGIITDGDVRRALHDHNDLSTLNVDDVMTKNPITVSEYALLREALDIMEKRASQISVLPVINDNGKCSGVIRLHDIVRTGI